MTNSVGRPALPLANRQFEIAALSSKETPQCWRRNVRAAEIAANETITLSGAYGTPRKMEQAAAIVQAFLGLPPKPD